MESLFHTLKTELVRHKAYATRDEAKRDSFAYMEDFYNRRRLHPSLGYRAPVQAEQTALRMAQITKAVKDQQHTRSQRRSRGAFSEEAG